MVLFLLFILIPSQVISIPNLISKENSKKFPINELKLNNLSDKEINKQQHETSTLNQQVNNKKHNLQIDNRFRRSSTDLLPLDELELPASNGNILQSHDIITSSCDPNCLYDESDTDIKYQNRNAVNENWHKNKDNLKIFSKRFDDERYSNFNLKAFYDFFNKRQSKNWKDKLEFNLKNNQEDAYDIWNPTNHGDTLSQQVSGLQIWNSVNLSGKRERPNYITEPQYILIRKALEDPEKLAKDTQTEYFVPPRGRRDKFNNLLKSKDFFMPNRGKKDKSSESTKKSTNYMDILNSPDLFVPNRGKKQLFDEENDLFFPNRGKKSIKIKNRLNPVKKMDLNDLANDLFIPNRGKKLTQEFQRQQRNLLDNLSQENQDTFYSARGRRTVKELKNINEDAVKKYWRQLWPFTV